LISSSKLIQLYTAMVKSRMLAERAGGFTAATGREAAIAGVTGDLVAGDTVSASPGLMAATVLLGAPPETFFATTRPGTGQRTSTPTRLEGASTRAEEHRALRDGKIEVTLCTDEDLNRRTWPRLLALAGREKLPVVFVRYYPLASAAKLEFSSNGTRSDAAVFGVPLIRVDARDVVAVYRVASESILRARDRRGPSVIDCIADVPPVHASNGSAPATDPIAMMERHLAGKGLFQPALRQQVEDLFGKELDRATGISRNQSK
jgi:hypothetical protein